MEAEIRQLELDRPLFDVLPENLQEQWLKYRPDGQVDADAKLLYDGQRWCPQLTVRCLNVSFTHYKFPYRLEHGTGTVTLQDDVLQANLTAYSGNQLVRVDAKWQHPMSGPVGWLEIKGDDLPLDEKLLAALPERSRAVGPRPGPPRRRSASNTTSGGSRRRNRSTSTSSPAPIAAGSATRNFPTRWPISTAR